jgi:hypothetical protein
MNSPARRVGDGGGISGIGKFAIWGSAVFGIATVLLGLIMLFIFPVSAELSAGFRTPIIAFEFAKTDADLAFISGDSASSRGNRERMDAGHRWDMAFPFAYAGFVALLLLQIVARGHYWAGIGMLFALLIIPFDIKENYILLAITNALRNSASVDTLLRELHVATWLKWGALGVSIATLAIGSIAQKTYLSALVSGIAALSIAICWLSGSAPALAEAMSAALFLFFLFFSIRSAVQAWKLFATKRDTYVSVR